MSKDKPSHLVELHTMTKLARLLDSLPDDAARLRVLAWAQKHYVESKGGK